MMRPYQLAAIAGIAVLAGACDDDSTRPGVETSTIAVRAYVDANGSGVFDAGDVPLNGASVTLSSAGGASLTATTDETGLASFADVEAGSYQVIFAGEAPAGAVLATASRPVVAAPAFGAALEAEFRFVYMPGDISGVLFRDENGDQTYDPGDTPAPGIPVALHAGQDASGAVVAQTVTDSAGGFTFEGLRPGTYTLVFTPFPTMELAGGNTQTVTVEPDAPATPNVTFTGNLLSPIADARAAAAAGETTPMAVRGVVSWQPGFSDELFIQDETAGIQVFAAAVNVRDLGLERGDTVIVVGNTAIRFGELQLTNVSFLTVEGSGAAPVAVTTTAAELNAGERQHELVQIPGATVTAVEVLSFGNQFVSLVDAAGNAFGVYVDSRTGVEADTWTVGNVYGVSGVPGFDSRFAFPHRIEIRGPEDVVTPITVAEARLAAPATEVAVVGVVTWQPTAPSGTSFSDELFIQDSTGGIQVFARNSNVRSLGLQPGDTVWLAGATEDRFGERQITGTSAVVKIGEGPAPAPVLVTPAQIAAGEFIHQLVTVQDAVVTAVETISFGNQLVTLRAPDGQEFGVYVDSRTGVAAGDWTVGAAYDVTGVINFDSRFGPFNYRIWIRSSADKPAS